MHDDGEYQAHGVYDKVAFASFNLFSGIETVLPPF